MRERACGVVSGCVVWARERAAAIVRACANARLVTPLARSVRDRASARALCPLSRAPTNQPTTAARALPRAAPATSSNCSASPTTRDRGPVRASCALCERVCVRVRLCALLRRPRDARSRTRTLTNACARARRTAAARTRLRALRNRAHPPTHATDTKRGSRRAPRGPARRRRYGNSAELAAEGQRRRARTHARAGGDGTALWRWGSAVSRSQVPQVRARGPLAPHRDAVHRLDGGGCRRRRNKHPQPPPALEI